MILYFAAGNSASSFKGVWRNHIKAKLESYERLGDTNGKRTQNLEKECVRRRGFIESGVETHHVHIHGAIKRSPRKVPKSSSIKLF